MQKTLLSNARHAMAAALVLAAIPFEAEARAPDPLPTELPIAVARQTGPARQRLQENAAEIVKALKAAGDGLRLEDENALAATAAMPDEQAIGEIQKVLDRYALALVDINDEAWFQIIPAAKSPSGRPLRQNQWSTFLVKVNNHSRATSPFEVRSVQAIGGATGDVGVPAAATGECEAPDRSWAQWFRLNLLREPAIPTRLSGKEIEYFVLQMCSLDAGERAAELTFYLGGGQVSQGHYGAIGLLFRPTAADTAKAP